MRDADGKLRAVVGGVLNLSANNFLRELAHSRVGVTGCYCLVSAGANPRCALHPEADRVLAPARALGETCGAGQPESDWEIFWPTQPIVSRYLLSSNGWEVVAGAPGGGSLCPADRRPQAHAGDRHYFPADRCRADVAGDSAPARPLEHLHRTVRQLAMQPAAVSDLPVQRDDEIGELASSFAEVLHQLSERESALKAAKDRAAASEADRGDCQPCAGLRGVHRRQRALRLREPGLRAPLRAARRPGGRPVAARAVGYAREHVANAPYLEEARGGRVITFTRESADGLAWKSPTSPRGTMPRTPCPACTCSRAT